MTDLAGVVSALRQGGSIAAEDEAADLLDAATDADHLSALLARRLDGEPVAWLTGRTTFCGLTVAVHPGVYVPRWKSEALAVHALDHLPHDGAAIDLCTGSGAVAAVLQHHRPAAVVTATDLDPAAVACARANGVDARCGSLFDPLPPTRVDVITAVPPYVPTAALARLPRDVTAHEPRLALDGGGDGLDVARRIVHRAPGWLRPSGALVIEAGMDELDALAGLGLAVHQVLLDGDGDPAGLCLTLSERR